MANSFLRYVIVGTFNTGFSFGSYLAFVYLGLGYAVANFLSLIIGIVVSFKTQGHLVFRNPDNRLFGRFVASWLLIYLCSTALIACLMDLGFDAYRAGAMSLPGTMAMSYLMQKFFVFRHAARNSPVPVKDAAFVLKERPDRTDFRE